MNTYRWMLTRRDFVGTCAATAIAPSLASLSGLRENSRAERAVGILGAGEGGLRAASRFSSTHGVHVSAIADPDFDAAARVAACVNRLGRATQPARLCLTDDDLLNDPSIGVIVVAANRRRSAELAKRAAASKKFVLVASAPVADEQLVSVALAASANGDRIRYSSRCADPELCLLVGGAGAPRSIDAMPRSVTIDCAFTASPEGELRIPDALFAEIAPAVAYLGSVVPQAVYTGSGLVAGSGGTRDRTVHACFAFPGSGSLQIRGRAVATERHVQEVQVLSARLRFGSDLGVDAEVGFGEDFRRREGIPALDDTVDAVAASISGDRTSLESRMPGSLRTDLIAAFILANSRA